MRLLELSETQQTDLKHYLRTELSKHRSERSVLERRWVSEALDFWAEASVNSSELPNTGFATIMIPLTAIAAEAIHARIMGMIYAMKELVICEVADQFDHLRPGLDKFFNHEFLNVLNFRERTESALLELEKHGTGIIAVGYRDVKRSCIIDKEGKETDIPLYVEKGTCVDSIPISDFLMPFVSNDIETAPWCGNDFRWNEREIKQAEAIGLIYPTIHEKLLSHFSIGQDSIGISNIRDMTDTTPVFPSEVVLQRIFMDFDVHEDNELYGIEVIFHELSNTICHVTMNPERPYEKGVYMPLENRWYGYGIAKQNKEFQVEVTTQHRQRIDNATIANMSMFKIKNSARAYIKDDEPIFPGKKFYVEEMDDIQPLMLGDVKASAYNNENQVVIYSQQRTGVNDLIQGMPNVGTPGTASDSMARLQESNRKFDYSFSNVKTFMNRVAYKIAQSVIKYGENNAKIFEFMPKGAEIQTFLSQKELLKNKFVFNIRLVGAKNNKVLDRNTYTQLVGMHTQYVTSTLQMIGQLDPAMVGPATEQVIASSNLLYLQILNAFDIPNPEKLVLNLENLKRLTPPPAPQPQPQPAQPGISGMAPPSTGGLSSIMAPGANINLSGGPQNLQLSDPTLSLSR